MIFLGKKDKFSNIDRTLQPLIINDRPSTMPTLEKDEVVLCVYNQFVNENLYWCQTVEDMQHLFDNAAAGGGFVFWHKAPFLFVDAATVEINLLNPEGKWT